MATIGMMSMAASGHLNSLLPLGLHLKDAGHRVIFFGMLDAEEAVRACGLEFSGISPDHFPLGSYPEHWATLGKMRPMRALVKTITWIKKTTRAYLRDLPDQLKAHKVACLIVDQVMPEGSSIAEAVGVPSVSFCSALPLNEDPNIPPVFTAWPQATNIFGRLRNKLAYALFKLACRGNMGLIDRFRAAHGLAAIRDFNAYFSPHAQIAQMPPEFDFPRENLRGFHYTGPFHSEKGREQAAFPWEKLDTSKPLIYASMGTIHNGIKGIYQTIASACAGFDAQTVLSLGGGAFSPADFPGLPGNVIVVAYAPQLKLLERASLVITHAGLNTTLEALSQGVPLVALPMANDQPGVAARILGTRSGRFLTPGQLTPKRLAEAMREVLGNPLYRENAERLKISIKRTEGVRHAKQVIEDVIREAKENAAARVESSIH